MNTTRNLRIEAEIDARKAKTGAREVNRVQDEVAQKAKSAAREQVKATGGVIQAEKQRERASVALGRRLETLERQAALSGKRGVERIRAQEQAMLAQARAAGATAEQIKRIGTAYDEMARRAEAAQRRTAARQTAGGGAGGGMSLAAGGALASRGLGVGVAAVGAFAGAGAVGGLVTRARELEDVQVAMRNLARNSGMAEQRLMGVVGAMRQLDFSTRQTQEIVARVAQSGIPQLMDRLTDLAGVARNLSTITGNSIEEALGGLLEGVIGGQGGAMRRQGLVIQMKMFEDAYAQMAQTMGKAKNELTATERIVARLNFVLEKGANMAGAYESAQDGVGGATRRLGGALDDLMDSFAQVFSPAMIAGANGLAWAFDNVAISLANIKNLSEMIQQGTLFQESGRHGGLMGALQNRLDLAKGAGAMTAGMPVGAPSRGAIRTQLAAAAGGLLGDDDAPPAGPPEPAGRYGFSQLTLDQLALDRVRAQAMSSAGFTRGLAFQSGAAAGAPFIGGVTPSAAGGISGLLGFQDQGPGLPGSASQIEGYIRAMEEAERARLQAVEREARAIEQANQRIFDDLRFQSQGLFRAMLAGGGQFWNAFRNLGLTVMSDVMSRQVAAVGMGLLGRGGAVAGMGGMAGMAGGLGGMPGAPGGTSGFAGPVAGAAGGGVATAAMAGGGAGGFGVAGLMANPGLLGMGLAVGATQLPGRGPVAGGIKGGLAGGLGMGSAFALFPSLLAAGPVGLMVGGAIAGGALLGSLMSGARRKARQKVRKVYGVDIKDNGILQQIVETGKSFGGNLAVAVQSSQVRELVQLYAMATGQTPGGVGMTVETVSAVRLRQSGGMLFQDVQFVNGRPAAAQSGLPMLGVSSRATVNVVSLDAGATERVLADAAARAVAGSGELVQLSAERAMRQSAGRRRQSALLLEPFTVTGS